MSKPLACETEKIMTEHQTDIISMIIFVTCVTLALILMGTGLLG